MLSGKIPERTRQSMKKYIQTAALLVCAVAVMAATAVNPVYAAAAEELPETVTAEITAEEAAEETPAETAQIANPWVDCETLAEAEELAGFDFHLPTAAEGFSRAEIRVIPGQIIQVVYRMGNMQVCLRKAVGTEDCSGDYNTYQNEYTRAVGNMMVTCKGNAGRYQLATGTSNGYSYSVSSTMGISRPMIDALADSTLMQKALAYVGI